MVKATSITGAACAVGTLVALVLQSGQVRTNACGLRLIGNAEGCQREAYLCPAGVLTDGVGNTHNVNAGISKNNAQIAAEWTLNILVAERCVNKWANGRMLSDNTFAAVTSLTFNAGCTTMKNAMLFRLLRQGKVRQACDQFPRWVYSAGKKLPGLVVRRSKEKILCLEGA